MIRYINKNKAQLIVDVYDSNGKRHRKTKVVAITGKKDANAKYIEFIAEVSSKPTNKGTVEKLCKDYLEHKNIEGIQLTTRRGYEYDVKRIISRFGTTLAVDLTPYQIDEFIAYMVKIDGLSPKSIKNTISFLSSAYKYGIRMGFVKANPCDLVTIPKQKKSDVVTLTEQDIRDFMKYAQNEPLENKVVYELALFCGMRRSEILGLTKDNINFNFKTIRIEKTRHRIDCQDIIQPPKTATSLRTISAPQFVLDDIKELLDSYISDSNFVIQYCGEPMRPDYAKRAIYNFVRKYDLPHVTLHGLRHTFATMLNADGSFDIAEISAALGHSNINTTLSIYTHIFESASKSSRRIASSLENKWCNVGANLENNPLKCSNSNGFMAEDMGLEHKVPV